MENRKKLVALKLLMAEDTEKGVTKSDSNTYSKGEIISATVHGQKATIIMDGTEWDRIPGSPWIWCIS